MNLLDKIKSPGFEGIAFARLVFLWLIDAAGEAVTIQNHAVTHYGLDAADIQYLLDIRTQYNLKATNLEKLTYALTVKAVIEMLADRSHVFKGRSFTIPNAYIRTLLELP